MLNKRNMFLDVVCVVIPIYKKSPTFWEIASFKQVLKILNRYDIKIYTHKELDISVYNELALSEKKSIDVEYFDKEYFSSVVGYNKLCLTVDFYKRVSKYDYMLIYQLDAWVFSDELEFWCNQGFDYIGAPFFKNWGSHENGDEIWLVGNGGFSLRRIQWHIDFLTYRYPISFFLDFKHGIKGFLVSILKTFGIHNTINYYTNNVYDEVNEDVFITYYIPLKSKNKRLHPSLPSPIIGACFSFEKSPAYLFKLCGKLPFGCHAFEKYEFETFWKNYISI